MDAIATSFSSLTLHSTSSASSSLTSLSTSASESEFGGDMRGPDSSFVDVDDAFKVAPHRVANLASALFKPSRCTGNKRALCIGINYQGFHAASHGYCKLRNCISDAKKIRRYLIEKEGFQSSQIRLLVDDEKAGHCSMPTRANILSAMKWLVAGAQKHDSLFFHFSGHGAQVDDTNKDEVDKLDEAFVPCDYNGDSDLITDDIIYRDLVEALPAKCRLTVVADCCSSGTIFDLPFVYRAIRRETLLEHRPALFTYRPLRSECPDIIFWSSCRDDQAAADKKTISKAFVKCMTEAKKSSSGLSYERLLLNLRDFVPKPKDTSDYERQQPQFGTHYPIDIEGQFFISA